MSKKITQYKLAHFRVFDFDITYAYRPNSDIYQEIVPKELSLAVAIPENFKDLPLETQNILLKDEVMAELSEQVMFDTPDAPDFDIEDVTFCFEESQY